MNKCKLHSALTRLASYKALGPRARSVFQLLWSLAGGAEEAGGGSFMLTCRARVETVMSAESCSRRTAMRALAELEERGFIARARTGRASLITLFVQTTAVAVCQERHIRGATDGTSDVPRMAHRAAPSICLDQDHLTKTTAPRARRDAAAGARCSPPPEPEAPLDGAAAVAFELLTSEAPSQVRFVSPFDRSEARRLVKQLADAQWPVVELVRYAVGLAQEPGVRSPRAMVIATLRQPDFHAVCEHAARLRALEEHREAAQARARRATEQGRAERVTSQRREERIEAVIAAATPAEISAALDRVLAAADPFAAKRWRAVPREQLVSRQSIRGLLAEALDPSIAADAAAST